MVTTGSTKSPFKCFFEKAQGRWFVLIFYTYYVRHKEVNIKRYMKYKMYKAIVVKYSDKHTKDMYKVYNPDTKKFIMGRDIKWEKGK